MSKIRHTPADEPYFIIRATAGARSHGAAIAPHVHDWHQLILARRSVISVRNECGAWAVPPGFAVWAAATAPHSLVFHGASDYVALYFRPSRRSRPGPSTVVQVSGFLAALMARAAEIGLLDRRIAAHKALARLIDMELAEQTPPPLSLVLPHTEKLRALAAHVLSGGAREGVDVLARRFELSARTLERQFHAETGVSFGRWRRHARLLEAIKQLGQGAPVSEAAQTAGYRSASAFIAAFGEMFGATPGRLFARE